MVSVKGLRRSYVIMLTSSLCTPRRKVWQTIYMHRSDLPRTYQRLCLQGPTTPSPIHPNKATTRSFQKALIGGRSGHAKGETFTPFPKGIHTEAMIRKKVCLSSMVARCMPHAHTLILLGNALEPQFSGSTGSAVSAVIRISPMTASRDSELQLNVLCNHRAN